MNKRVVFFLPILFVVVLGALLSLQLGKDPTLLESARLDDPFPSFKLTSLLTALPVDESLLKGSVTLVNVWATWCPSCQVEHPYLVELANTGVVRLVGLNYKDDTTKALDWLVRLGNPYEEVINDPQGTLGFDLGVYGAPETYLVDAQGVVRYRHVGVLDDTVWKTVLAPKVAQWSTP